MCNCNCPECSDRRWTEAINAMLRAWTDYQERNGKAWRNYHERNSQTN